MKKDWDTPLDKLYNPKAEKAKARRFNLAETRRVMEVIKEEDEKWRKAEEEGGRKTTKKREEQAKKRAEAVARKAMNRILADMEQPQDKDAEKRQMDALDLAKKLKEERDMERKNSKIVREIDYVKMLSLPITNVILDEEEDDIGIRKPLAASNCPYTH